MRIRKAERSFEEPAPGALIAEVERRYRRRSLLLAGVAAVVAAAVAIPSVIVVRRVVASPSPAMQHARHIPTGLRGLPLPADTNLQLLVSTAHNGAAWYSTASGAKAPITGLSSLASAGFIQFGRVQGGTWESAGCVRDCVALREYYFIADGSRTATAISAGVGIDGVVASSRPGAVWLVSYPRGSHDVMARSAIARLVSTSGQALGPQYLLPAGYWLQAAVGRYFLLLNTHGKSYNGVFELWDPATRRVVRYIYNPIAASQSRIVWTKGCRGCHVQILNVATGRSAPTPLTSRPHPPWGTGSFSDDGQLLAYAAPDESVEIVSGRTGALLLKVPAVNASEWLMACWLNGGPTLMLAAGYDHRLPSNGPQNRYPPIQPTARPPDQIGIWQPGDAVLRVATVTTTAENYALVLWVGDYDNLYGLPMP